MFCLKSIRPRIFVLILIFSISKNIVAQVPQIQLDTCFQWAYNNYPLIKQFQLIEQTKSYSVENAAKAYMPQVSLGGQATYQSEVTKIPINLPNLNIPSLSKDQYKLFTEINQPLTEIFTFKNFQNVAVANAEVEKHKVNTDLYKLKERVSQIYFGILLLKKQLEQTKLLKKDLEIGLNKTKAAIDNGTAMKSNAEILNAEILKIEQKEIELKAGIKSNFELLSLFTNKKLDESVQLETPIQITNNEVINRPELQLFDSQKSAIASQEKILSSRNLPKFNVFLQSGFGRPALNVLNNDFDFYYIGGLRFNWNFTSYYTYKNEKNQLKVNQNSIDTQRELFLLNTSLNLSQANNEIDKINALLESDKKIIALRKQVNKTAVTQLENGIITANDYLTSLNAEDQATQMLLIHEMQLLQAKYNLKIISGN